MIGKRFWIAAAVCLMAWLPTANAADRALEIYFIDVLGGGATLIVTPAGESILVDSGWHTEDRRDALRIHHALVEQAGCERLDHSITTHWHRDHFGAISQVAEMVDVAHWWDKGVPDEYPDDPHEFQRLIALYLDASGGDTKTLRTLDRIELQQVEGLPEVELEIVAANRAVLASVLGEEHNPLCEHVETRDYDPSDNADSIAFMLRYGDFSFFMGGDITWNIESKLVCPFNVLGQADLMQVNHHGLPSSNNPVFVKSLDPVVAVMCNGPRKGGHIDVIRQFEGLPRLEGFYQLHYNVTIDREDNPAAEFVANHDEVGGEFVKAAVAHDGSEFTVTIGADWNPITYQTR